MNKSDIIKEVTKIVMNEFPENDFKNHTGIVVKNSLYLADKFDNSDKFVLEVAALLHDLGGKRNGWNNHEVTGEQEAEKILTNLNCDKEIIDEVKHCIRNHRSRTSSSDLSINAQILRDADGVSHFMAIPWLFSVALYRNDRDVDKATTWLSKKFERSYNLKLQFEESKELAKPYYNSFKLLFKN